MYLYLKLYVCEVKSSLARKYFESYEGPSDLRVNNRIKYIKNNKSIIYTGLLFG